VLILRFTALSLFVTFLSVLKKTPRFYFIFLVQGAERKNERDEEMNAEAHKRGKHKETENTQRIEIGNKSEGKCCTRQQ